MPGLRPAYLKWQTVVRKIISGGVPAINTVSLNNGDLSFGTTDGRTIVIKGVGTGSGTAQPLTSAEVAKAINNGIVPNISGSIKGLGDGWWKLLKGNTDVTGRPPDASGDLVLLRQKSGPSSAFILVAGQDKKNKPAIWTQARIASTWTGWTKFQDNSADITKVEGEIAGVTGALALLTARVEALENEAKPLTMPQIENALKAIGWGPLPSGPAITPGKDRPGKVTGIPKIWAGYSLRFPTSLNSGLFSTTSGVVGVSRSLKTPERIFIIVPMPQAEDVTGIQIDGGLAAKWGSRDLTYDNKPHRVFYSAGAFHELSNTIRVLFGNQQP